MSTKIIQILQPGVDDTEILVQDRYGQPIPYVVITPVKKDTFASSLNAGCYLTDKFGKATICGPAGEYLCKFERREFHTAEEKISIGKGEKNIITLYYVFEEMPDNPEDKPDDNSVYNPYNHKIVNSGPCGENLTWTLDSEGTLYISGTGRMNDYYFDSPFHDDSDIKSVIIDDGVEEIGAFAFYLCGSLESVTIPDSVTSIGDYVFDDCENLTSVKIPSSVTSIGVNAFNRSYLLEIKGYNNSCAQEYAETHFIEFVPIGNAPAFSNSLKTSSLAIDDEISVDSQLKNSFALDSVDIMDDEPDVNETEYTTYTFTDLFAEYNV